MRGLAADAGVDPSQVHRLIHGQSRRPRVLQQVLDTFTGENSFKRYALILAQLRDEANRLGLDGVIDLEVRLSDSGSTATKANALVLAAIAERVQLSLNERATKRRGSLAK